jgi:hypothetical protein
VSRPKRFSLTSGPNVPAAPARARLAPQVMLLVVVNEAVADEADAGKAVPTG